MSAFVFSDTISLAKAVKEGLVVITVLGTQDYYDCQVCHRVMTGSIPAQSHLQGSPHMKTLRNYLLSANVKAALNTVSSADNRASNLVHSSGNEPELSALTAASQVSSGSSEIDMIEKALNSGEVTERCSPHRILTCKLCNITCTGDIPMNQHLSGESHRKNQRKSNLPDTTNPVGSSLEANSFSSPSTGPIVLPNPTVPVQRQDFINADDDLIMSALEKGIVTQAVWDSTHLTCVICQSSCTGRTPMKQHLKGSAHLKRVKVRGPFADVQGSTCTPAQKHKDIVQNFTLNSPSQSSEAHRDVLQSAKDEGIVIQTDFVMTCTLCSINCCGEVPMTAHLKGEAHHKKLRARGLLQSSLQRCALTPPMSSLSFVQNVITTPVPSPTSGDVLNSAKKKGIILEAGNVFECMICDTSCVGVAPATDHVNSEAHQKNLRDQVEYQHCILEKTPMKDSASPCLDSPSRKSNETSLSSDTAKTIPDVSTVSDQYKSVSQPNNSTSDKVGCSHIKVNSPKSGSGTQVYSTSDSLNKLFE